MIDIEFLQTVYFTFDKPVDYCLKNKQFIKIYPVFLKDSIEFLMSVELLKIEKNESDSIEIIQMSYLDYLRKFILKDIITLQKFSLLLKYCLGIEEFSFLEINEKVCLQDLNNKNVVITSKDFDEIKRIILYQNLLHYDDEYVSPDIRKAMEELDELKMRSISPPNLERRIAIITAHTGVLKKEQIEMTLRSHSLLFEEVSGEVEYSAVKPIAVYGGKADSIEWINKKIKNKYEDYFVSDEKFSRSMGGDGKIKNTVIGENN